MRLLHITYESNAPACTVIFLQGFAETVSKTVQAEERQQEDRAPLQGEQMQYIPVNCITCSTQ
jgi:hypothetical protein